jgi:asparagine synthase (glutamine-hydrolysing)
MKGSSRGPEFSVLDTSYPRLSLGFHRLAINGLNPESNQPLVSDGISVICNGEIYNYKFLYKEMNITPTTQSDCEIIIHLYKKYGIEQTLTMMDGVFSFILVDQTGIAPKIYVARDPYGVRPLYELFYKLDNGNELIGFASELKCLSIFYNNHVKNDAEIRQFQPATYSEYIFENDMWSCVKKNSKYMIPTFPQSLIMNHDNHNLFVKNMLKNISYYVNTAVIKRCISTERPVACLLSGGLDSSLIAALVNSYQKSNNPNYKLETYSIGLKESEDLKYAKIVANYLQSKHTEIVVTEEEMFNAIPEVIHAIESYDTTTVRASIGNYLIGKYIREHSEAKVIFNGDGSDELFGGYLYMNHCPDDIEFDRETRRLLKDIYLFDVLRSDKSISSHGLEPRTPFLDKTLVNYVLNLPPYFRNHKNVNKCEKFILRYSFYLNNFKDFEGKQILPDIILWRKKEAFSDGVSSQGRSLFQILHERIGTKLNLPANIDTEKFYYKQIFDENYPMCEHLLPYFWMPRYTNATDPSARTLDVYAKSDKSVN